MARFDIRTAFEVRVSDSRADTKRYAVLIMRTDKLITYRLLAAHRGSMPPEAMEILEKFLFSVLFAYFMKVMPKKIRYFDCCDVQHRNYKIYKKKRYLCLVFCN